MPAAGVRARIRLHSAKLDGAWNEGGHQHAISMQSERSHLHDSTRLPQAVLMLDSYMHPGAAIIRGALPTALSSGTTYIESMQPTGGIHSLG